ncbi:uncharacterized protein FIBRA_00576 [Fibroporia radiculosa]|uniref:MutL C-terminal dimerisation domain-containing protein n=1 Tax=Fibroporia radiculosa TaxID=599839 RepID=J4GI39_9APHY|nr:uncharacterized protein FIBRA_00576 [Fibroporia radiculosa]CCL98575.1 predicted protein [Fibroporia radiculosa]
MNNSKPGSASLIHPLPSETQSKLRSTQILTSFPQIISELVQNSLDAGAKQIDIGVDCEDWACWVRDDGVGIGRDSFDVLAGGSEAGRYGTSKAYSSASLDQVSTFGFRGEALASAADLSCLEISSRTARSRESWSVILKGRAVLYNGPSVRWRRDTPGTVVFVRDAFYNVRQSVLTVSLGTDDPRKLPIRRLSHPSPVRTIELIRRDVETSSLMFPNVSFTFENSHKAKEGDPGKGRIMTVPRTSSSLATFRHLYGKALAQHIEEIDETDDQMRLHGFISLDGAQSKAYQFLYINRHILSPCDLHRLIDAQFSKSSFMKHAFDEEGETSQPRLNLRRSPRKSEKKPAFVLNLTVPPRLVDNCIEPAKASVQLQNSGAASKFLGNVIEKFLIRNGFLFPKRARSPPSMHDKSTSRDTRVSSRKKRKTLHDLASEQENGRFLSSASSGVIKVDEPSGAEPTALMADLNCVPTAEDTNKQTIWTDPSTGEAFVVDARTGNSYPVHMKPGVGGDTPIFRRRTLGIASGSGNKTFNAQETEEMPAWIRRALETNSTYKLPEPRIPSLAISAGLALAGSQCCDTSAYCALSTHKGASMYDSGGRHQDGWWNMGAFPTRPGRFNKTALHDAEILGQVDRKFIACMLAAECDKGKALVLIDQHAADERVRVERFLKELCLGFLQGYPPSHASAGDTTDLLSGQRSVTVRELVHPVPVLLTRHEVEKLAAGDVQVAFKLWGLAFTRLDEALESFADPFADKVGDDGSGCQRDYVQVHVRTVPEVVADKLLAGDELKDLVKGYLAKLDAEGAPMPSASQLKSGDPSACEEGAEWQKAMRWCPRELLELVNSKACRGAIMFNDPLTLDQCTSLVQRLAQTALPFQPSLVPLADVGTDSVQGSERALPHAYGQRIVDWSSFAAS